MKLIPGRQACSGGAKTIPAAIAVAAMKLAVFTLLAGSSFLWSCSDPVPAIELDQFMSLVLSGAKETSVIKKLNLESTADTVFYITMTYGGTNNYERGDITATLGVDYSLVEAFNAANHTEYLLLPEETYSFDRMDTRIANGINASEPVKLTLRMSALNLTSDYLLPVTVKSVTGSLPLNEEMKTLYLVFQGDVEDESGRERWTGAGAS
jgi:hypothetical protein